MLNFDKYREEFLEQIEGGKNGKFGKGAKYIDYFAIAVRAARNINGDKFPTSLSDDIEWLFYEYEPPLLENGDGLKTGDWIMVRDFEAQSFVKRQFLYFYGNRFYCARKDLTPLDNQTEWYVQARLPEDGE